MDNFILTNHPCLTSEIDAQHEIHIFLNPVNPSESDIEKYYECVDKWNRLHSESYSKDYGTFKMKACLLKLIFREKETFNEVPVTVMQSAVYIKSNCMKSVISESHKQVEYFTNNGFSVLREKIEACAYGIQGIPKNDTELIKYSKNDYTESPYFEAHIKCELENGGSFETHLSTLRDCCNEVTLNYNTPCPFSYNCNKNKLPNDNEGRQMFINSRFRGIGLDKATKELNIIKKLIISKNIKVVKIICEYVWYDTFPLLDKYWIDFDDSEKNDFLNKLKKIKESK